MPSRSVPSVPPASSEAVKSWWVPAASAGIVLAGLAAYSDSLRGPFIYDDLGSIPDNPTIRHLWPLGAVFSPPGGGATVQGRPILNLSLAINYAIGGPGVWGYHALNLMIHILAGLTLFGITRRTLENAARARRSSSEGGPDSAGRIASFPTALAFAVALIWTVHPLQTESVTYIIQRAESLMGLFYLLTFYCFIRFATDSSAFAEALADKEAGQTRWAVLSVLACFFGMGTKEVAATLPVMVFLYDRTFVSGSFSAAWRQRRRYYLALGATWILLARLLLTSGGNRGGSVGFGAGMSGWAYLLTQFEAIVRYLCLAFWPHPLVFDYGPFLLGPLKAAPYAAVVVALGGATLYAFFGRPGGARRTLGFAGVWLFGILAVTSLVPGTSEMIVERRMYLPLAAVVALFVLALDAWLGRRSLVVCLALACGLGGLTWRRNHDYRSDLAIWSDSVARYPANARAQYNLGVAYFNRGDAVEEIAHYEASLRLDPANAEAQHSVANALFLQGRAAEAFGHFQAALGLRPADARLRFDYGTDLFEADQDAEAMAQFAEAIRLRPDYPEAHDNLGIVLAKDGRLDEAVAQFQAALRIDPNYAAAHHNLGLALGSQGRQDEADAELELAERLGKK